MNNPFDPAADCIRLYGSCDSANLIVRFVLEELGLPYEFVSVDRANRLNRSEEYLKLNPQGLIPVLTVPGQSAPLFETAAILLFLADREARLAPDHASPDRGRFLSWLFFLSNTLHSDLRISFRPNRYTVDDHGTESLSEGLAKRLLGGFDHIETCLSSTGGPYLMGDDLSILDFYTGCCCRWYQLYPHQRSLSDERWPRLTKMLGLLQARESVRKSIALEEIPGSAFLSPQRPQIDEAALTGV